MILDILLLIEDDPLPPQRINLLPEVSIDTNSLVKLLIGLIQPILQNLNLLHKTVLVLEPSVDTSNRPLLGNDLVLDNLDILVDFAEFSLLALDHPSIFLCNLLCVQIFVHEIVRLRDDIVVHFGLLRLDWVHLRAFLGPDAYNEVSEIVVFGFEVVDFGVLFCDVGLDFVCEAPSIGLCVRQILLVLPELGGGSHLLFHLVYEFLVRLGGFGGGSAYSWTRGCSFSTRFVTFYDF